MMPLSQYAVEVKEDRVLQIRLGCRARYVAQGLIPEFPERILITLFSTEYTQKVLE